MTAPVSRTTDPLDTPLPCDVRINHIIYRKGVSLRTLVDAATRWHTMATEAYLAKHQVTPLADLNLSSLELNDEEHS